MKATVIILIALVAAAGGLGIGLLVVPQMQPEPSAQPDRTAQLRDLEKRLEQREERLATLATELTALSSSLKARDQRIEALEAAAIQIEAAPALKPISGKPVDNPIRHIIPRRASPSGITKADSSDPQAEIAIPVSPAETEAAPLLADLYDGALSRVDWKRVGTSLHEFTCLTPAIIGWLDRGRPPSLDLSRSAADAKHKVMMEVLKLEDDVPGTGVNGKFTNPAFAANAILVTLKAAGSPLSAVQEARLAKLARRYLEEDDKRRSGYAEDTFELEKLLAEVKLKGRFFDECYGMLTAAQGDILSPARARGRIKADAFSEASVFGDRVRVHTFKNENSLAADVHDAVRRLLGGDGTLLAQARGTVQAWAMELPREEILTELNTLDRAGMITAERATGWGGLVLDLLKSLVANLNMSEERARSIRELTTFSVPVR